MTQNIFVIGSNMVDLMTYVDRMPKRGETLEAPEFSMGFGGKGANQAVAASRLGADVSIVTCVGDDVFGGQVKANLAAQGVNVDHVRAVAGKASGVAPIFVAPDGENAILIVKGANADLSPEDIDRAAGDLRSADVILLQLEVPLDVVYHAVAFGQQHGIVTILNPAPADRNLDIARLEGLDWFCPNETELALLTGLPTTTETDVIAAARHLIARGISNIVVTLGGRGALLVTADGHRHIKPIKVDPVDTTGAGDAFIGSFARFLSSSEGIEAALTKAAKYAAHSITGRGTQTSYASSAEFDQFCAQTDPG